MMIVWLLAPIAVLMGGFALGAFIWAARGGQMDDLATPPLRMLLDDQDMKPEIKAEFKPEFKIVEEKNHGV